MANKEKEKAQFDRFRENFANFPEGKIELSESPDFLITTPTGVLGIELTELYWKHTSNGPPFQAKESIRQRIVAKTQAALEKYGVVHVWVTLSFSHSYLFNKNSVNQISEKIVEIVLKVIPENEGSVEVGVYSGWELLPEGVDEISVARLNDLNQVFVDAPEGGFVPKIESADLESRIIQKATKLPTYLEKAGEVWLVIVADHSSFASWFDMKNGLPILSLKTGFNRVFLFELFAERIHELENGVLR